MTRDLALALAVFAVSNTFQPGPNNVVLMASGLNFGFARTVPAILGLTTAFCAMMLAVGFSLAAVFEMFPLFHVVLQVASVVYLLYLAWRVAHADPRAGHAGEQPLSFVQGAVIILLNPQGWIFATSFVAAYLQRSDLIASVATLTVICGLARLAGACAWALFGSSLRNLLSNARAVRKLNVAMALLMVASLWPIVADLVRRTLVVIG